MNKIATHKISACYFPATNEVELTWEDIETGKHAALTTKVTSREGAAIAKCVPACVYWEAVVGNNPQPQSEE